MELDIANLKDEVGKLTITLQKADEKIDEIENQRRRNNVVMFNVPDKCEGDDCIGFIKNLLKDAGCPEVKDTIQRAHRSGRPSRDWVWEKVRDQFGYWRRGSCVRSECGSKSGEKPFCCD